MSKEDVMSRYTFEGSRPELSIVVGWDNPLKTYFAQVWDGGGPGQGELRLWVGAGRDKVPTAEMLAELVAPYGEVPTDVLAQLDEDHELRTGPTTLQRPLSN
jgi:hypothetical protein